MFLLFVVSLICFLFFARWLTGLDPQPFSKGVENVEKVEKAEKVDKLKSWKVEI